MNVFGQDQRAKKSSNVRYDAQYKKNSDGRIILIQVAADSDSQSLKNKLDKKN